MNRSVWASSARVVAAAALLVGIPVIVTEIAVMGQGDQSGPRPDVSRSIGTASSDGPLWHDTRVGDAERGRASITSLYLRRHAGTGTEMTQLPAAADFRGLRPEEAAAAVTLPPGFRAQVFAGEPDVRQPVAFAIDDRGRLWVAEAYVYPTRAAEGQGKDRVLVFEDVDGDGRFDRRTIFVEGLNLVSGIEVGFGGLWVGAAPYLLFYPIADGDTPKPAGEPRVLLDGWGYQDTHETLNTFVWGPDGWLYGAHGVFTHSAVGKPGTPEDQRERINAGIWRYHPVRHEFEVFAHGTSNPWGLDFNERGHAIIEACVIPHLWHVIQGARYHRQAGQHFNPHTYADIRTVADHVHYVGETPHGGNRISAEVGGGHAHAGLMVYQGGSWPEEYRGQAFMGNIHGARINIDTLDPKGSGYVGRHRPDFMNFNDPWSQVVNLQYDQDGSVFMIDWYDQEQCHVNDPGVPDRGNGRIFKVVYGDTPTTRVDVQALSDEALVLAQFHKNEWHVRHARRVLQERAAAGTLKPETLPRLRALLGLDGTAPSLPLTAAHRGLSDKGSQLRLLWAVHAISTLSDADVLKLLQRGDEDLRAWGVQVATERGTVAPAVGDRLASLARTDSSPVVRLYLASAAQRLANDVRWNIAEALYGRAAGDVDDHNLPLMLWYTIEPLVADRQERALQIAIDTAAPRALEFTARRIASIGTPESLDRLVATLRSVANDDERALAILIGVNAALQGQRDVRAPSAWASLEGTLAASSHARLKAEVQSLGLTFGSPRALAQARLTLASPAESVERRREAMTALLNVRDANLSPLLFTALDVPLLRAAAIRGLAGYADPDTPSRLLALYPKLPPVEKRDALMTLASRPEFAKVVVDELTAGRLAVREIPADVARQIRLLGRPDITAALESVWGVARDERASTRAEIERYTTLIASLPTGVNDRNGRVVFNQVCAACHKLFGTGGDIGPDITGSNRRNLDYLLHNILDPNAEIPNEYRTSTLELRDGRVLVGIANVQDPNVVIMQTPNERITVPRSDIQSLVQAEVSMMPEGLLTPLSDEDVRDLIAYLRRPSQVSLPVGSAP